MHWGVRKASGILASRTSNLESWGKDKDHNILYITGYSGSGKSTLAQQMAGKHANIIHLDHYFESDDPGDNKNKAFNSFLKEYLPDYKELANPTTMKRRSREWFDKVDTFMDLTEKFSKEQYPKKKVIVEGVQLSDATTYPDKSFFKDKPLVIMGTGSVTSFIRASKRDGRTLLTSAKSAKEYIDWYISMHKSLDTLAETANAKKGEEWIKQHYS